MLGEASDKLDKHLIILNEDWERVLFSVSASVCAVKKQCQD